MQKLKEKKQKTQASRVQSGSSSFNISWRAVIPLVLAILLEYSFDLTFHKAGWSRYVWINSNNTSLSFLFPFMSSIFQFLVMCSLRELKHNWGSMFKSVWHLFTQSNCSLDNEAPPTKVRLSLTSFEPFDERVWQPNTPFTRLNITSNTCLSNRVREPFDRVNPP